MLEKSQSIFAKNIHFYRKRLNLTQKQLAHMIGCTASLIGYIENEKTNVPLETIESLAKALNVRVSELFLEHIYDTTEDLSMNEEPATEYSPQVANLINDLYQIVEKYKQ